jgi:PIN domain nuclease of toxin-antitoxin system
VSVLLDAFALIALLAEERAAEQVETLIRRGDSAITTVNFAEALDVLQRVGGIPRERLEALPSPLIGEQVRLAHVDEQIARDAADVRARHYHRTRSPLSLADCVLLAATGPDDTLATADTVLIGTAEMENVSVTPLAS